MIRHAPIPLDDPLLSPSARSLIKQLLVRDPPSRLGAQGAKDIQAHAFFQGIDWDAVERKELSPPWVPSAQQLQEDRQRNPDSHIEEGVRREFQELGSRLIEPGEESEGDPFADFTYLDKESMRGSGSAMPPRMLIRSFTSDKLLKKKKEKAPLLQASSLAGSEVKNKKKKEKPKRGHRRAFSIDALTSIGDKIEEAIMGGDKRASDLCPLCNKKLTLSKVRPIPLSFSFSLLLLTPPPFPFPWDSIVVWYALRWYVGNAVCVEW